MPVNLLNEKTLNQFLTELVFDGQSVQFIPNEEIRQKLSDIDFVQENADLIIKCMVLQYVKHRVRAYLVDHDNEPFLLPVTQDTPNLPEWAKKALAQNSQIYIFDKNFITTDLKEKLKAVCSFLDLCAANYLHAYIAELKQSRTPTKFRIDCLKTNNQFSTIENTLLIAKKYQHTLTQRIKRYKREKAEQKKLNEGTIFITNLSDVFHVVQLTTLEALDLEGSYMHHCVGNGCFDDTLLTNEVQIYSIRDKANRPHVTFETQDILLRQCTGKNNNRPAIKYLPFILEFIKRKKFKISLAAQKMGIIEQDGTYYNIYNLPKGFTIKGDLDLSHIGLTELPDLSNVTILGSFNCEGNRLKSLKGSPKKVDGSFNCAYNELSSLNNCTQEIGKNFICDNNKLETLLGGPTIVGRTYSCANNRLNSLEGVPNSINGNFICRRNHLINLLNGPIHVRCKYDCSYNILRDLIGAPINTNEMACYGNQISPISAIPIYAFSYPIHGININLLEDLRNKIKTPQKVIPHEAKDMSRTVAASIHQHSLENQ